MTRRDYELIAAALKGARPLAKARTHQFLLDCHALAGALATTNPRFDRERFLIACGVIS